MAKYKVKQSEAGDQFFVVSASADKSAGGKDYKIAQVFYNIDKANGYATKMGDSRSYMEH